MGKGPLFRSLCHHRDLPGPLFQLRQGPEALEAKEQAGPAEAQSGRLIEVERSVSVDGAGLRRGGRQRPGH